MENQIMEFLSSPQISDIISWFLILMGYIFSLFVKKFVRRDNLFTSMNVSKKVEELNVLKKQLEQAQIVLDNERAERKAEIETWQKEKQELLKVQEEQAKAIALIAGNVPDLVKNGVANKVAQDLKVDVSEDLKSVEVNDNVGGN